MRLDVLAHRLRQLLRRRRRVLGDRNAAERRHDFGEHRAIERNAGDGEPGRDRRMRVHDGLRRPAAGGRPRGASASRTRDRDRPASFCPSRSVMHIMSGVMKPLQTLFGVISSRSSSSRDADVAVVRRGVAARVQAPADFDDVGAQRGLGSVDCASSAIPLRSRQRLGAEEPHRPTGAGVSARDGHDEGAADRIAHQRRRRRRRRLRAAPRCPRQSRAAAAARRAATMIRRGCRPEERRGACHLPVRRRRRSGCAARRPSSA